MNFCRLKQSRNGETKFFYVKRNKLFVKVAVDELTNSKDTRVKVIQQFKCGFWKGRICLNIIVRTKEAKDKTVDVENLIVLMKISVGTVKDTEDNFKVVE